MSDNGVFSFDEPKVKQELCKELFNVDLLLCPKCGFDYTHLEKIEEYKEKDNRLCVKLHFYCENGCKFVIDFHQHEGMTYVKTTNI